MEVSMAKLFVEAEKSLAVHNKLIKKMIAIYVKSDFEKFFAYFVHLLKYSLIHTEKHPIIERVLSFVCKFSTSVKSEDVENVTNHKSNADDEEVDIDPLLVCLFEFLLENHEANNQGVRYRVCQLVNKLLNSMGQQATIDDELYRKIYDTMLQRLMDKVPVVRVQAIHALSRLQEPRNKECPVLKAYLFHLCMDPNSEVRRAVLNNIAVTIQTLPSIIERTRDTVDLIRKQAYLVLAQKVHIRSFTIAQRIRIVSDGLNDRSKTVQNCVKKNVLQAWLRLVDGDVLELLKCLDVEASAENTELVLSSLFNEVPYSSLVSKFAIHLGDDKKIPAEHIKAESALYWKCLAKHLRAEKADEHFDLVLPDLVVFCDYLRSYLLGESEVDEDPQETAIRLMEKDFIAQQLLALTLLFDMSDEVGRKSLANLCRLLCLSPSVSEACVRLVCDILTLLFPPAARITELAEIVSEIRTPPQETPTLTEETSGQSLLLSEEEQRKKKLKIAQLSVKMNQVRDDLEECIRSLNLEKAAVLKETLRELDEQMARVTEEGPKTAVVVPCSQNQMIDDEDELNLRDDPETMSRCLSIVCGILAKPDIDSFGSVLRSLHDNLVLPCLKSGDLGVRRFAVKTLALNCLISKELAEQYQILFIQIARIDVEEIQMEAIRALFDMWHLYGIETFSAGDETNAVDGESAAGPALSSSAVEDHDQDGVPSNAAHMIELLTEMLNFESSEAKTLAAEGLCKLLLASRISSSKLLSLLVVMWYNPITEEDHLLRHMLGVFFPYYASFGGSNQESLNGALVPTLHTIFNAPLRSPLSSIDVDDVVNFLVSITSPSIVSKSTTEASNAHDSLVFTICAEILAFPNRESAKSLVKALPHLVLTPTNFASLKQVHCLVQKILKKINEKSLLNTLEKFSLGVQNMLQFAPQIKEEKEEETLTETKLDELEDSQNPEQSVNGQRRKRILYSTFSEPELLSNGGAEEGDQSPFKLKKSVLTEVAEENESKSAADKTVVAETDDEVFCSDSTEIELSVDAAHRLPIAPSSSDLFSTPELKLSGTEGNGESSLADVESSPNPSLASSVESSDTFKTAKSSLVHPEVRIATKRGRSESQSTTDSDSVSLVSDETETEDGAAASPSRSGDKQEAELKTTQRRSKSHQRRKSLRVSLKRLSVGTVQKNLKENSRVTRSSLSTSSSASSVTKPQSSRSQTKQMPSSLRRVQTPDTSQSSSPSLEPRRRGGRSSVKTPSDSQMDSRGLRRSARK